MKLRVSRAQDQTRDLGEFGIQQVSCGLGYSVTRNVIGVAILHNRSLFHSKDLASWIRTEEGSLVENLRWCRWWWKTEIKLWRNRFSHTSANSIPAFRKHAFPRLLQPPSAFHCFSRARVSKENFKINRHLLLWVLLNIQTSLRKRPLKTVLVQLRAWRLRFLKDDLVYQRRRLLNIKATSSFFRWLFYHAFYLEYGGERLPSRLPLEVLI